MARAAEAAGPSVRRQLDTASRTASSGTAGPTVGSSARRSTRDIAADCALSRERRAELAAARGREDDRPAIEAFLRREGTTAEETVLDLLRDIDVEAYLRGGGLTDGDIDALRARMLGLRQRAG